MLTLRKHSNGKIIYGGSFNPLHIGHLRLAIQTLEIMGKFVGSLDFVPAAIPPHKKIEGILPFQIRCQIIREVVKKYRHIFCNDLESQRIGASYTFDTLLIYLQKYAREDLYFLLGSHDYGLLPQWSRGLNLPSLCNLIIVPRGEFSREEFIQQTVELWSDAVLEEGDIEQLSFRLDGVCCMLSPFQTKIFYLPLPYLEISASSVRELWMQGRNVEYLVPEAALNMLEREKDMVFACWQRN